MDFVNFIEKTKVSQDAILLSMDVTSLYTNIPLTGGGNYNSMQSMYAKHSTAINLLYRHTTSKKYLNLFVRKIHSNLLETIIIIIIFFFIVCKITLLTLLTVRAKYITRQYSILPTIHVYWLLTLLNKTGLYLQFNTDSLKHNSN